MHIRNIASYKFVPLTDLETLKTILFDKCQDLSLKGTILLSEEGINLNLAGEIPRIEEFQAFLRTNARFEDLTFRESHSDKVPFLRLKVKIKKEIITFKRSHLKPTLTRAPSLSPLQLKKLIDEKQDITLLDTRNDYEIDYGTFKGAVNLHIKDFSHFPIAAQKINKEKPVVMFCTGGIRCEKAALELLSEGFKEVYQLEGGILNYFAQVGGDHYEGSCFVFDERIALDPQLQSLGKNE